MCVAKLCVRVTKFQSRRAQSESEHAVWRQLASHLTQPEHIAHCFVLASSRAPGQRDDRRHHVGLLGAGAHSNHMRRTRIDTRGTCDCSRSCDLRACRWTLPWHVADCFMRADHRHVPSKARWPIAFAVILGRKQSVGPKHTRPRHPAPPANEVTADNTSVCTVQEHVQ